MTIELQTLDAIGARTLTDEIKLGADQVWDKIVVAYIGRAWTALGYQTWDDYCTTEFEKTNLQLPRETRRKVVCSLKSSGLSIRAIAAATSVDPHTVRRDLDGEVGQNAPPDLDEVIDAQVIEPTPTTGLDGKTYQPSTPRPTRRPAITKLFTATVMKADKAACRAEQLSKDSRFPQYLDQAALHLGDLIRTRDTLQRVINQLSTPTQEDSNEV